ncbi:MAG: type II secretion system ATPase GspE [Candidatus Babeliales bacterium]
MKRDIRSFLIKEGIISQESLDSYSQKAENLQLTLPALLLQEESIDKKQLAQAFATYMSLPYIKEITEKMASVTLLAKVPLKFLRDNIIIPIIIDEKPVILTANPFAFQSLDNLNILLNKQATYGVTDQKTIYDAINQYYPIEGTQQMIEELEEEVDIDEHVEYEGIDEKDIISMATEAPIIKLVNHILFQATKRGASDIHIEPFEKKIVVRYRIDGVLYEILNPPKRAQNPLASRIKIMAHLNIAEKRIPQDGRIDIRVAGRPIDIRVSILPVSFGERIVMRLLDKTRSFAGIEALGLSERDLSLIVKHTDAPNGIIYITGPTGSGKTTTLYSILTRINNPESNIITVEDPVEYQMSGIGQVQVKEKVGLTFAAALRSILRQDPDIIMIGETRDQETAHIAIQAALTGHLVLSTLHTNSAPATITRLLDMNIEPYLIASSITLAIAQRLVRKLCEQCKQKYTPEANQLLSLGLSEKEASTINFYKPQGCSECIMMGYKGRLPVFEIMEVTPEIAQLIMEQANTTRITHKAIQQGMTSLMKDGIRKIKLGITTIDEVLSVAHTETYAVDE